MRIILIGYSGYWGRKLHRVLGMIPGVEVETIDRTNVDSKWPWADAAIIATPPDTHFALAMKAISLGMDVLVEKPMTMCPKQANRLVDAAEKESLVLSVDSTFLHTAAFKFLSGLKQPLISYQSIRLAPPMPQAKITAGWDLIVHDMSILHGLGGLDWGLVNALGTEDGSVATATLYLPSGGSAFIMASRAWPEKERSVVLHFPSGAYLWKLDGLYLITKKGAEAEPFIKEDKEPLETLLLDFIKRCQNRELKGVTDGLHGAEVVGCLDGLFPQSHIREPRQSGMGTQLYGSPPF